MTMVTVALIWSAALSADLPSATAGVLGEREPNYSITAEPYLTGGLFTNPLIPKAGEVTTITVRATCVNAPPEGVKAEATVLNDQGIVVHREKLTLQSTPLAEGKEPAVPPTTEAAFTWQSPKNGMFR